MLVACENCHRQYDVGSMQPGERVRCQCATLITVPHTRSHTAQIIHCSSCGGKLDEGSATCAYCGGAVTIDERNLGDACPECFARLRKGAKFCRECGVKIRPETLQAKRLSARCPRCEGELVERTTAKGQFTECSSCGGLWLDEGFFEKIVEDRDTRALGSVAPKGGDEPHVEVQVHKVKYLACPVCGRFMNRKNFAGCSGVIIDWCKGHGFWFDTHELEKIVAFVAEGGMDQARERKIRRAKQEINRVENRRRVGPGVPISHTPYRTSPVMGHASFDDTLTFVGSALKRLLGF